MSTWDVLWFVLITGVCLRSALKPETGIKDVLLSTRVFRVFGKPNECLYLVLPLYKKMCGLVRNAGNKA